MFSAKFLPESKSKGNNVLQPYFKNMQRIYKQYYKEHDKVPNKGPSAQFVLQQLCDEYVSEGKKIGRVGQYDLLAEKISKELLFVTDLPKFLHAKLTAKRFDASTQFADLLRAFLAYYPEFIPGFESILFSENKPEGYSYNIDDSDLETLLSMTDKFNPKILNVDACTALGDLALAIPERYKARIVEKMQNCIESDNPYIESSVYYSLAQIASSSSSDVIYENIVTFLKKRNEKSRDRECPPGDLWKFIENQAISHDFDLMYIDQDRQRQKLIETALNDLDSKPSEAKQINLANICKLAENMSPAEAIEMITKMLSLEDFSQKLAELENYTEEGSTSKKFVKIYLKSLIQLAELVPTKLKLEIIYKLLTALEKIGNIYFSEAQLTIQAITHFAKQLPAADLRALIQRCLSNSIWQRNSMLQIDNPEINIVLLGKLAEFIPADLRTPVVDTVIKSAVSAQVATCVSLSELCAYIPIREVDRVADVLLNNDCLLHSDAVKKFANSKFIPAILQRLQRGVLEGDLFEHINYIVFAIYCAKGDVHLCDIILQEFKKLMESPVNFDRYKSLLNEFVLENDSYRIQVIKLLLKQCENDDPVYESRAYQALAKLTCPIPEELKQDILKFLIKGITDSTAISAAESSYAVLCRMNLPISKQSEKLLLLDAMKLLPDTEVCHDFLMKAVETFSKDNLEFLFDAILEILPDTTQKNAEKMFCSLLEKMMQQFPGKWEKKLIDSILFHKIRDWSDIHASLLKNAISHLNKADQNLYLFGKMNSVIDRLKLKTQNRVYEEKSGDEFVLSRLIKVKTELCCERNVNLMLNQEYPKDICSVVMSYV